MERPEWPFEPSGGPFAPTEDMFTLPANMSNSSFWNAPFPELNISVDGLQAFPPSQDPTLQTELAKNDDNVSDVTDAQLSSPATTRLDPVSSSPSAFMGREDNDATSEVDQKLKPRSTISKPKRGFMPALSIGAGRSILKANSVPTDKVKAEKSPVTQKRPADESSRQRHNQMMRENRGRFNKKFKELTDLLESMKPPECDDKPMKNKIQILERAMYQYALMESQRAEFKNELLFSPPNRPSISTHELEVIASAPSLEGACELVVRSMCGSLNWKYGEVWTRSYGNGQRAAASNELSLSTAFVSPKNMPSTRRALQYFAKKGRSRAIDKFFLKLAQLKHGIWISNFSSKQQECLRAKEAAAAGVTTLLTIPISISSRSPAQPDAVIVLLHADDDLLSFPEGIRSYDSESICRLTDLSMAVVRTRSHLT